MSDRLEWIKMIAEEWGALEHDQVVTGDDEEALAERRYTPRKPTVIERVLLKLHARLAGHEKYARASLGKIFSDVLRLPDPDALVQPTLEHLLMLQVFQSHADISTLGKVAVQDLERTARGDQMLQDDLLPAAQVDDLVTHVYDPIRRVLMDRGQQRELRSEAQPVSLSHEPFRAAYPAGEIAAAVPGENHHWWHPNSVIGNVRRRKTEELWYDVRGDLVLSDQGQLSVEFSDETLTSYVNGLDADTLIERILRPALYDSKEPERLRQLEERDFADLRPLLKACVPLSEVTAEANWSVGVRLVKDMPGLLTVPEHAPSRTVIAVFGDDKAPAQGGVSWNADDDGACVRLPDAMPVPGVFYYNGNGCCLGAARFGVQVNGLRKEIALGYAYEPQHVPQALRDALTNIEQKLAASPEPMDRLLVALWRPTADLWQELFEEANRAQEGFPEGIERLLARRERLQALIGEDDVPDWDRRVADLFLEHLDRSPESLVPEIACECLTALGRCQLRDREQVDRSLVGLQKRLQLPTTVDELNAMFAMLMPFGPAGYIPFPSRLYTDEVLRDYANRFPEEGFADHLRDRNPLEQALRQLKAQQAALERALGLTSLSQLHQTEEYTTILRDIDVMHALRACQQWTHRWDSLCRIGPALSQVLSGTELAGIHERVQAVSHYLDVSRPHAETRVEVDRPELGHEYDEGSGANGKGRRPRDHHRKKRHHSNRHRRSRRKNRR